MTRPLATPLVALLRALGRAYPAASRAVGRVEATLCRWDREAGA
jgi:hypothetical protein